MCEFITAILPRDVDVEKSKATFLKHKRGFELLEPHRIVDYVEKGDLYILTTRGKCDCGTALGAFDIETPPMKEEKAKRYRDEETKKLKAQGWSENKIRRRFEQTALSAENYRLSEGITSYQLESEDILSWLELIQDFLTSKITSRIGLLVHSYHSGVENERLPALDKKTVALKDLSPRVLCETRKDVIYQFVS